MALHGDQSKKVMQRLLILQSKKIVRFKLLPTKQSTSDELEWNLHQF